MATRHLTNRRTVKTTDHDHYITPAYATRALMYYEDFEGEVAEPCCGTGEMAEVLKKKFKVKATDLVDRGYGGVEDFLKFKGKNDNVVTNPPFDIAEKILSHALKTTRRKVVIIIRLAFLEGQTRYSWLYTKHKPTRVLISSERISMFKGDDTRTDGGTTAYAWFIWHCDRPWPETTEIKWIRPGFKAKKPQDRVKRFIYGKKRHAII